MPQRLARTQPTEWHRVGDWIKAATILTRADFVNVHRLFVNRHVVAPQRSCRGAAKEKLCNREGRTIWMAEAHHRLLIDDSAVALEEPFRGAFEDDATPADKREGSSSVHVEQLRLRRQPLGEILSATIETR